MKRILAILSVSLVLGSGGALNSLALVQPERPMLPDFDRRLADRPGATALAPSVAADLKARVPDLQITVDKVLGVPNFFSSRAGFLTGPDGAGLGVKASSLQGFAADDPHRAIKAFLNEHAGLLGYGAEALGSAVINRDYVTDHNGLRTVVWQQQLDGISVFQAIVMGHVTKQGELVNLATYFVPNPAGAAEAGLRNRALAQAAPPVSLEQALVNAAQDVGEIGLLPGLVTPVGASVGADKHQKLKADSALRGETDARLVWLPMNGSTMRLCWQFYLISASRMEMFLVLVDAETGDVLLRRNQNRYLSAANYRVYSSDSPSPFSPGWPNPNTGQPALTNRALLTIDALDTNASPHGWIDDGNNITSGNNVDAYADLNGDFVPDQPRVAGVPNRVFDFAMDLTQAPNTYASASVTELFYIINRYHDTMYSLGFTEAAGNMQADNLGRGGIPGDPVEAGAQVGGMYDNAFMMTTPDGISPTMICLLFSGPTPMRDSAFDAEVVLHENTHGVTERVLGGGVGVNYAAQSGGIHEGNSDWFGLTLLTEPTDDLSGCWAEGGYLTFDIIPGMRQNYYFGIRRYPYTTNMLKNPLTYKDIDPTQARPHTGVPLSPLFSPFSPVMAGEVHNAGEVWCVTLWEMRVNLVASHGWTNGNRLAMQTVLDGERLAPANPNFLQLRDAILLADRVNTGGLNQNDIWAAFAKRGMGGSATSPDSATTVGVVEAYDMPGVAVVSALADDSNVGNNTGTIDPNECAEVKILLRNGTMGVISNVTATLSTTNPLVSVLQPDSLYPGMAPGEAALNLVPYRIYTSPAFPCGSVINFALTIRTLNDVRTNFFVLPSGYLSLNTLQFSNNTPAAIPDNNTNGVDSAVTVSGVMTPVGKVTVSLYLTHPADGELVVQLISPDGTKIDLANRQGGNGANFGTDCAPGSVTTFDEGARTPISAATAPFVGSFRPDQPLAVFSGKAATNANGLWRLRVADTKSLNTGLLHCWSLALSPIECVDGGGQCVGDLTMQVTPLPEPVLLGSNLTYAISLTNGWPGVANGVVLTNWLPTNVVFVSATNSQGTFSNRNGILRFDFGAISNGVSVSATVIVTPTVLGQFTNLFGFSVVNGDFNLTNNSTNVVCTVVAATPVIVAGATRLLSEGGPVNYGIDPGETNTLSLGLRNIGPISSASLTASLLAGNGVVLSLGPQTQTYGVIASGYTEFRPFTFTALGVPGSVISATLQLSTNGTPYTNVTFNFTLSGGGTFANSGSITINSVGAATPYPATNLVSGLVGVVSKVKVTLSKFTHSYPQDVDILLVSPTGQKVFLMGDAGGNFSVTNRTIVFDQAAASALPATTMLANGSYRPANYSKTIDSDAFVAPAPAGPYASSLDMLLGYNPNGTWLLYVMDDTAGEGGAITGGWSLTIDTVTPVDPVADLAVTLTAAPESILVGNQLTYTATVTNQGSDTAPNVVLRLSLPASVNLVGASSSSGTVVSGGSHVTVTLAELPVGSNLVLTVSGTPTAAGSLVATATVTSDQLDLKQDNNTASVTTTARNASANLAVSVVASPNPVVLGATLTYLITVTNQGPDAAAAVWLTNTLPAGAAFVSVEAPGTNFTVGGQTVCSLSILPSGASLGVVITVVPNVAGILSDIVKVGSSTFDPVASNNTAIVSTTALASAPVVVTNGAALVQESVPANNAIEPGEIVTLSLSLRNAGTGPTANLQATLQATAGLVPAGPQIQTYGTLLPGGASVSRPFQFQATANSGSLTVVLALQNAGTNLGTVSFLLPMSSVQTFSSSSVILIPQTGTQIGKAAPYPSTIVVSNVAQTVSKVTVTLNNFSHAYISDVDVLLVGPRGQKSLLLSDVADGFGNTAPGVSLTFDDDAADVLPASSALATGTFKPTDYQPGDTFPAPAPAGPYTASLSVFNGINPNGAWSNFVNDAVNGDSGIIGGGWSLNFFTTRPMPVPVDLGVASTASPGSAVVGTEVTLTVTAANSGPADASGVVLTDVLPVGFDLLSAVTVPAKGTLSQNGNTLVCYAGSLANGESFELRIVGRPTLSGTLTNIATITGVETDSNPANNVSVQTVSSPLQLTVKHLGNNVLVTWPNPSSGYILESSPDLGASANWQPVDPAGIQVTPELKSLTIPVSGSTTLFYRLHKP